MGSESSKSGDMGAQMRIIELEDQVRHYRNQVQMHHNGMIDISIMIDEGDIDAAKAKALSFFEQDHDNG